MSHAQKKSEAQMHSFHNKFAEGCKVEALLKIHEINLSLYALPIPQWYTNLQPHQR